MCTEYTGIFFSISLLFTRNASQSKATWTLHTCRNSQQECKVIHAPDMCYHVMLPHSCGATLRALTVTCISNSLFHTNAMPHTHSWKCRRIAGQEPAEGRRIHTKDLRNHMWWLGTETESYFVGTTRFSTSSSGQNPLRQPDTRCPASLLAHTKHINQSIQAETTICQP